MRKLTNYELRVLIKNEIYLLSTILQDKLPDVGYCKSRAEDILKYCNEYYSLEE